MTITTISGTSGADTLIGTADSDMIFGYAGNDSLVGGAGDDTLDGGSGTNRIDAGDGNDVIVIDGTATNGAMLTPATGIDGGTGYDTISFLAASTNFHITQIAGGWLQITDLTTGARTIAANVEHLQFTDTDIYLVPQNLNPPVVSGDVTATVTEGDAVTAVSALANATDADPGAVLSVTSLPVLPEGVTFDAASQSFVIDPASPAFDALAAGERLDLRIDYAVTDGAFTTPAAAVLTVIGSNDAAQIAGQLTGSVTEDKTPQAAGQITVTDVDHGEAAMQASGPVAGAYGVFAMDAAGAWSYALNSDLLAVQALNAGQGLTDSFTVASVDGTTAGVTVSVDGSADKSLLVGTDAANSLTGGSGADQIFGQGGADRLSGRGGNDHLDGGAGVDSLSGDGGNDRIGYDAADALADGGAGVDTLVLTSAATVNLSQADQVAGDAGLQTGFENVDAAFALQSVMLRGSDAANALTGGWGDNVLRGGKGADVLTGGAGADSFVFAALAESAQGSGIDTISDFAAGQDRLDLSLIDAITGGTNDAFRWIGEAAFSHAAGELRYSATTGLLQGDVNGDGLADFSVVLANHAALTAADILL